MLAPILLIVVKTPRVNILPNFCYIKASPMLIQEKKSLLILCLITFFATLAFWFVFYLNLPQLLGFPEVTLETIFANYDGPNYMVISKCFYDKSCIGPNFSLPQPLEYYPAHFPGYPLLIRLFSVFTTGPKAMLTATLLGSLLLTSSSYIFFRQFLNGYHSFWLSFLLIFFPARLFVLRLIGAPETWFISLILLSLIFFRQKNFLLSAVMAALAQTFKTPAVILLFTYLAYFVYQLFRRKATLGQLLKRGLPFLLSPLVVLLIFSFYRQQTGNFWAYFSSGDNIHLNLFPYLTFVSSKSWLGTIWLEDVVYLFLFAVYGIYTLIKRRGLSPVSLFPFLFTLATIFVAHRDISRYLSPIYPFLLLAFSPLLTKKSFRLAFLAILPAIWLYAINFVIGNTAPISNWAPYL